MLCDGMYYATLGFVLTVARAWCALKVPRGGGYLVARPSFPLLINHRSDGVHKAVSAPLFSAKRCESTSGEYLIVCLIQLLFGRACYAIRRSAGVDFYPLLCGYEVYMQPAQCREIGDKLRLSSPIFVP